MEICESQKPWKANQSHKAEENHFFNSMQQNKINIIVFIKVLLLSYQAPVALVVRTHRAAL